MGSITVPDRSLQRQKKPSVTLVFCKLRPSFSLSRQLLGPFGEVSGTEAAGSSSVAPANIARRALFLGAAQIARLASINARSAMSFTPIARRYAFPRFGKRDRTSSDLRIQASMRPHSTPGRNWSNSVRNNGDIRHKFGHGNLYLPSRVGKYHRRIRIVIGRDKRHTSRSLGKGKADIHSILFLKCM